MPENERRRRWRRQRRILQALVAATVICTATYLVASFSSTLSHPSARVIAAGRSLAVSKAAKPFPSRPIYPYSVIRGGAYSAAELIAALDRDPVAARHYLLFRRSAVRTARPAFPEPVFLSYRLRNAIYWTSHPVHLPPAEILLTDGQNYARARCGNRISPNPQTPVNDTEPAEEVLNTPQPAPEAIADLDTWSDNRLTGEEPATAIQLRTAQRSTASDWGIGPTTPSWWILTPPVGFLTVPVTPGVSPIPVRPGGNAPIEPNPIPGLVWPASPVTPSTPSDIGPGEPILPGIPTGPILITQQIPAGGIEQVPEPTLLPTVLLACAAIAVAKFRRRG